MIFVDTGGWYAAMVPQDANHNAADSWLWENRDSLVTTDYVVDELLTLFKSRNKKHMMLRVGQQLFSGGVVDIVWVTEEDVHRAWDIFRKYADKEWSFTDCVSRAVMGRLGIKTAFSFDEDFRQFGDVTVVP